MSAQEVRQKFRSNAARVLDQARIAELEDTVLELESRPNVTALLDLAAVKELEKSNV
jgi:hypothetical protein